jgi:HAE1 family hydrophobic/amphiphilic exporter-1
LTLSPALCGMLLRPSSGKRGKFFSWFNRAFDSATGSYMAMVKMFFRRSVLVGIFFVALLAVTGWSFTQVPVGFVPSEDEGYFFVNATLPNAASLDRSRAAMDNATELLMELPGVQNVMGVGGFSLLEGVQGPNFGMAIVSLVPWNEREHSVPQIMQMAGAGLGRIREGTLFPFAPPPIQGLGTGSGFEMQVQDRGGLGLVALEQFANDIVAASFASPVIERPNQGFRSNVPQLYVEVDRERVKRLGIPLQSVFSTLSANLGSAYVNDFNLFGRTWRVLAQADESFRTRVEDIGNLEVRTAEGRMVPLAALVTVTEAVGPSTLSRFNMFPAARITGVPAAGFSDGQAVDEIERLAKERLPAAMGYEWSGVTQQQKAAGNTAPLIFGLALVMVFLFLAAQYESWSTPLSVLLSVPLALLGATAFTAMRGFDMNIYTQIGLVLLIGLSAKSAIMIVEFAKAERDGGMPIVEAATKAAHLRFRPILMTAFSFILGVIPLVIATGAGARSRVSLGTAVFGGMLVATVGGVFLIPWLYVVIQKASERGGSKKIDAPPALVDEPPITE